jgi:myo-inositol 2-dehydrogenase/D-chiro-inositol 1-dehydrogenase
MADCDAVIIASSTDSHAEFLVMAAEAGLPTFCEKPIAADIEVTDRAISAVERAGNAVQMGFNRRFDRGFSRAKTAVADGTIGKLMMIVGQHHDHRPPPEAYIPASGGQFKDQLIHDFDLLRFVSGDEVVAVHAAGSAVGVEMMEKYGDTAVSVVTLWLSSGAMATLCGARLDAVGYDVRMEVFGTEDSLAVGLDSRTPIRSVEDGAVEPADPYTEWLPRFGDSYRAEMEAFLDMAQGRSASPCTVYDARAAIVIAEACGRSIAQGRPIELEAV